MTEKVKEIIKGVKTDISGKWINVSEIESLIKTVANECANTVYPEDMQMSIEMRLRIEIMNEIKSKFGIY